MRFVQNVMTTGMIACCLVSARSAAGQEAVLHSFGPSSGPDGSDVYTGLVSNSKGDLLGATRYGGVYGSGAVFELTPVAGGGWTETVIYSLRESEGYVSAALILDARGNLYGTTFPNDSSNDKGTAFELSPTPGGGWTKMTIYNFGSYAMDGTYPSCSLTIDLQGNLFGTTRFGGENGDFGPFERGYGTVFELVASGAGTWSEKVLYNFGDTSIDGQLPEAGVVLDPAGHLYGTTYTGGLYDGGTAFELISQGGGSWTEKILHNFSSYNNPKTDADGSRPISNLVMDSKGNLYGTTPLGGYRGFGTIFELSPLADSTWAERAFIAYANPISVGITPAGNLTLDAKGNVYGTYSDGGIVNGITGEGTVFQITPYADGSWAQTVLHSFPSLFPYSASDGSGANGGLILDSTQSLYGTTSAGGSLNAYGGTVFRIQTALGKSLESTRTSLVIVPSEHLLAGQPISLTSTVTSANGTKILTGTVTFANPVGGSATAPLVDGVATYNGKVPAVGSYSVYASYNGDDGLPPSTSVTYTMTVSPALTE